MVSSISMHDFLNLKGINVIDIRSREKFNSSHIDGAKNVPYEKIITDPSSYLDKGVKYYLYCQKGTTSYSVCNILCKLGYSVVNINGGYESYILNKR